eukprot:SAG31_NODE_19060_length_613_cov_0.935798_1_plen_48_part_10
MAVLLWFDGARGRQPNALAVLLRADPGRRGGRLRCNYYSVPRPALLLR